MDIYREHILDHYKNPRNYGHLHKPHAVTEQENVTCGDRIAMEVIFAKDTYGHVRVSDIRFSGVGCVISQASASLLTEKVRGMDVREILKLTAADIMEMLGTELTPTRVKCAVLSLEVLDNAIQKHA